MSAIMFGCRSSCLSTQSRSSALFAKWTQTNVVSGWRVDDALERGEELFARGVLAPIAEPPAGVILQLLPAFVRRVVRVPERLRIRDVDRDGHTELAQACHIGSSFGSSMRSRFPFLSRRYRPSRLNSLKPAAPRRAPHRPERPRARRSRARPSPRSRGSCTRGSGPERACRRASSSARSGKVGRLGASWCRRSG